MSDANFRDTYEEIVAELVSGVKTDLDYEESETEIKIINSDLTSTDEQFAKSLNPTGVEVLFLRLHPEPYKTDGPFWKLILEICEKEETFFTNCFVHDLCPLSFTKENKGEECYVGPFDVNIGSEELRGGIEERCLNALVKVLLLLRPKFIVAMGKDANEKADMALWKCRIDASWGLQDQAEYVRAKSPSIVKLPHPTGKYFRKAWNSDDVKGILTSKGVFSIMRNEHKSSSLMPSKSAWSNSSAMSGPNPMADTMEGLQMILEMLQVPGTISVPPMPGKPATMSSAQVPPAMPRTTPPTFGTSGAPFAYGMLPTPPLHMPPAFNMPSTMNMRSMSGMPWPSSVYGISGAPFARGMLPTPPLHMQPALNIPPTADMSSLTGTPYSAAMPDWRCLEY